MGRISRRVLDRQVEEQVFETLWEAVSEVKGRTNVQAFLNDLLTPVERVMVAKRLAIAVLLLKKMAYGEIVDLLKVSNETIARIALIIKNSQGFNIAIDKVIRSEAGREIWREIENLIYRFSSPGKVFLPEEVVKYKQGRRKRTIV